MPDEHDYTACGIVSRFEETHWPAEPKATGETFNLRDAIAAALRSVKAPPGCVIDENGAVRKVLGKKTPLTADGAFAMPESMVFVVFTGGSIDEWEVYYDTERLEWMALESTWISCGGMEGKAVPLNLCYSTRELAEKARAT